MNNNIARMMNSTLRLSGLASGLDTDTMVKQLMRIETMKVDKVKQQKQLLEWKRDGYRNITNSLRGFRDTYLDVLSATNMKSEKNYKVFSITSSDSNYVTAKGLADATAGSHSIQVNNVATAEVRQSNTGVTKDVLGNAITDTNAANASGKSFNVTIDGTTKTVNIGTVANLTDLEASIQLGIDNAFGSGKVQVDLTAENKLTFLPVGVGVGKITLGNATVDNGLDIIGFTSGASFSNRLSTTDRLEAIVSKLKNEGLSFATVNDKEVVQLTINNKSFTFDKSMTLSSMMSQISSDSEANVNMKYDSIADKFVITSKQTGQGSNINISETGSNLLSVIDLSQTIAGEDAEAIVDGQFITRSNNTFAISGVSYTLLKETELDKDIRISLSLDVDKIFDNIKTFVGKYNELIGAINNELGEEYYKDYQPLTDEQKEVMSEEEIEKWEEKAKSGILRNDRALQKIVSDMRKALYEKIEGVPNGIAKIGITTGSYQENGKLVINETELRNAIQNTPDLVINIFSKESSTTYFDALDDSSLKTARYVETGLAGRLYDIIQDSIRTIRNKDDKKGILLEIAGIAGDVTEFDSMIVDEIKNKDKQINEQLVRLYNKETAYYQKFASMESALSQMNSQSAWLSQQFGSSQW